MLPSKESLTVEFKSDRRTLPHDDIVEAVVCLANTEGGELWLGVEDSGEPTGLSPQRSLPSLPPMIANRTNPSIPVIVEEVTVGEVVVAKIAVPKSKSLVGTSLGKYLRRRMGADGKPQCVPMTPIELSQRQIFLGSLDFSAQPVPGATLDDLDPVQRVRLRRVIEQRGGDKSLLSLEDDELEDVLDLTKIMGAERVPTLTGLLLLGRAERLKVLVPSHEIAFQVLSGTEVRHNEHMRKPLLEAIEEIELHFRALLTSLGSVEVTDGLFQISVPAYDPDLFREAFINAVIHRDYTRAQPILGICFDDDGMTISNPGGFVEGVTIENLLTVAPHPRNPWLADVMKRLGLAERTGRGVDRIFSGMLRFGRSEPDYSGSSATSVVLRVPRSPHDAEFMRMILAEENRTGRPMPVDALLILSRLSRLGRITAEELDQSPLMGQFRNRGTLMRLVEAGLVVAHGSGRGRTYSLSAEAYKATGRPGVYRKLADSDPTIHEQKILDHVREAGRIQRSEAARICQIPDATATKILGQLVKRGLLAKVGERRWTFYEKPS